MNILNWILFKDSFPSYSFLLAVFKLGLSSNYEQMTLETTSDANILHGPRHLFCNIAQSDYSTNLKEKLGIIIKKR